MKHIVTHTKNRWEVVWLEEHNASSHVYPLEPPLYYNTEERAQRACEKLNEKMEKDLEALDALPTEFTCDALFGENDDR